MKSLKFFLQSLISRAIAGGFLLGGLPASAAPRVIDDAVFAHDFQSVSGDQITGLKGPVAAKTSSLTLDAAGGLPFSTAFLKAPVNGSHAMVDTNTRLTTLASGLSFSIFYNDRGDNGHDGDSYQVVRLLTSYSGSGGAANQTVFGIQTSGGVRRLYLYTQQQEVLSSVAAPFLDSQWHQAGFTFDAGVVTFYLDGQPFGLPRTIPGVTSLPAQDLDWHLIEDGPGGSSLDEYFDGGSYDEAALWNRVLSSEEMQLVSSQGLATASVLQPFASTLPATVTSPISATLNGEATPVGPRTAHFEYGATPAYGISTPEQAVSGSVAVPVQALLTGLPTNARYYYRLVMTAGIVTTYGERRTFSLGTPPPLAIDDAVFAHDFAEVTGNQITPLAGPAAVKSGGIVQQTVEGLSFSPGFLRFPSSTGHEKIDTGVRLVSPTAELSFSIRYNGRGDNGSEGGAAASEVRLLSCYGGSGKPTTQAPYGGPYFGIENFEGSRRLVFRTQYQKFYSTATVPAGDVVWHQAAFTLKEELLRFYFDGVPLGNPVPLTGAGLLLIPAQEFDWTLGEDPQVGNTSRGGVADDYFDGGFYDEAALWHRTLAPAEILSLHEVGLEAAPWSPAPETPGTDYNVLVKRFDFAVLEASEYFMGPELSPYWSHQETLPQMQIGDGLLKFRNYVDPGNDTYLTFERLNKTANLAIDPGKALMAELEITMHRGLATGPFFQLMNGQHRYSFALNTDGFTAEGVYVPVPVVGRHVYRLEAAANSSSFRLYMDGTLKFVGTAPASAEQKMVLGDVRSDSDISYVEIRQADPLFVAGQEVAIHWEGDTPAGQSDYRWVQGGNWGFPVGDHGVGPVPQRADNVVFDLATVGGWVSVSSTQRATSIPSPHGALMKGLRLNQAGLGFSCPKPYGTGAYMGVHGVTLVQKNATILVEGRPGFFYTDALHVSGTATNFVAPVGRIDGRLSGEGQVSVTVLPAPPVPAEPYPIPPYPFPDALAVYGIHSPGGSLQHLDAPYVPGVGLQSIDGNLRYEERGTFEWQLAGTYQDSSTGIPGTDYDAVTVNGNLGGSKAVFRIVLPGSDTFEGPFWSVDREWDDIFTTGNQAQVNLGEIFTRFEYLNANGPLGGAAGPQRHGYFVRTGSILRWKRSDSSAYPAFGHEQMINGGGETGDLSGWSGGGIGLMPSALATAGWTDDFIFKAENYPGTSEISQRILLPPAGTGQPVRRFGFRGLIQSRLTDDTGEDGEIELSFRDSSDELLARFTLADENVATVDWQVVEEFGEVPEATAAVDIVLRATATAGAANRAAFDNLSFVLTRSTFYRKVDLDASVHVAGSGVEITLDPGSYVVRPSPLGRYVGWHGWLKDEGSFARNDTSGSNYTRGWKWSYGISTSPGVSTILPSGAWPQLHEDPELAYRSAVGSPLSSARNYRFTISEPQTVSLWIPEATPGNNGGGISLIVERAGEQDDALAHTLGPVAYQGFPDSPFRSVSFGAGAFHQQEGALTSGAGVAVTAPSPEVTVLTFSGELPTHAGIVWTGSDAPAGVTVEFFNADGLLVSTVGPARVDASGYFFGAVYRGGIKMIRVTAPGGTVQLADLQFGNAGHDEGAPAFLPTYAKDLALLRPGRISTVLDLPGGARLVGGRFTDIGGEVRTALARISASGMLEAWNVELVNLDGLPEVHALALDGDRLFIAGKFSTANGQPCSNLVVVSLANPLQPANPMDVSEPVVALAKEGGSMFAATSSKVIRFDLSPVIAQADWTSLPVWLSAPGDEIRTIHAAGAHVYVGGNFATLQGQPANGIARIDVVTGAVDSSWTAGLGSGGVAVGRILALAGDLLVSGIDETVSPSAGGFARKVSVADGSLDAGWTAITGRDLTAVALDGSYLFLADSSGIVKRVSAANGTVDNVWQRSVDGNISHLHAGGSALQVFGAFNRAGSTPALGWAQVGVTSVTAGPPVGVPGEVRCFARQPDGKLLLGGSFEWLAGVPVDGFARLLPGSDRLDASWLPEFKGGPVRAIAIAGDEIFIGGSFATADGVAGSLVKFELFGDGPPDPAWSPAVSGVTAIATSRDHVFAFAADGSTTTGELRRIGRLDGLFDPAWGTSVTNLLGPVEVRTLQSHGEHLYLAGAFTDVGLNTTRASIARVALATGICDDWNANLFEAVDAPPEVNAILFHRDLLYVAGKFQTVQALSQPNLARLSIGGALDISWKPAIAEPQHALIATGENLFIAGSTLATVKTNVVPALVTALVTADGLIHTLSQDEGRIVAGGGFTEFGADRSPGFAATPFLGSPRVSFRDGKVYLYPDDGTGPFIGGFRITRLTGGSLIDPVSGDPLGEGDIVSVSAGAGGLIWIPDLAGAAPQITVVSLPPAGLASPDLNPVTTVLSEDPGTPSFRFDRTEMEVYEGDLFTGFVNFNGSQPPPQSVSYEILPATARRFDGTAGDYVNVVQPLTFEWNPARQVFQAPLRFPVLEDRIVEGAEEFYVRLVQPAAGLLLGPGNLLRVRLIDGARASGTGAPAAVLDPLVANAPSPRASTNQLTVTVTVGGGSGRWRLRGEAGWRESNTTVSGLQNQSSHYIDYRPETGYQTPASSRYFLTAGQSLTPPAVVYQASIALAGNVQLILSPASLATASNPSQRARWRVTGDATWHNSDESVALAPGIHLVEFQSGIAGYVTPAPRPVVVTSAESMSIRESYLPTRTAAPLSAASSTGGSERYVGQFETDFGFATGTAVTEQTVLTAARVMWNPDSLTLATRAAWLHQQEPGGFRPGPRNPRSVLILSGYAQQLAADRQAGTAGNSTGNLLSDNLDVAVAYFFGATVARNGYSGFLADYSPAAGFNPWLTGGNAKRLIGYPMSGVGQPGTLHATANFATPLALVQRQVYATPQLRGFPGMEGSPLFCTHPNGTAYPAAIYLGENRSARFRALDGDVAELIYRAEFIAALANFSGGTGGGDEFQNRLTGDDFPIGFVQVELPLGVGRWRVIDENGDPVTVWFYGGEFAPVIAGDWQIEFEDVAGLATPAKQPVTVQASMVSAAVVGNYPLTFHVWAAGIFTSQQMSDLQISGPDADPDRDSIVNLLEFAFGLEPDIHDVRVHAAGTKGLPLTTVSQPSITVEFLRRAASIAPGLQYIVESSDTLDGPWTPVTSPEVEAVAGDPAWESVRATISPAASSGKRFSRVRVEHASPGF